MTRTGRAAFTLIELIVTLIILGIIIAIMAINILQPFMVSTHEKSAKATLSRVQTAEQLFARDWGSYSAWSSDLSGVGADVTILNASVSHKPTEVSVAVGVNGTLALAVAIDASTCVFRQVEAVSEGGGSTEPTVNAAALCSAQAALPAGESQQPQSASMKTTILNN